MERDRIRSRAQTDASLGAERASTAFAFDLATRDAQRVQDDFIERDRLFADQGLLKFRDRADSLRALQRSTSPGLASALAPEREVADEAIKAERENTDALVERERDRADNVIETERHANQALLSQLGARRRETDEQLTIERSDVDTGERELNETRSALALAQGVRSRPGDVLAMVSHDLRSPLSIISVNAQALEKMTKDVAVLEVADDVLRAVARMERLLTDLLDVARIDSGTLEIKKTSHEIGAFVTEVYRSYRPLFDSRGMMLSVDASLAPLTVSFDHDRIVQVLSNLLGNAMKFSPPHSTVSLRMARRDGEIEFTLQDNGPGIQPDVLPHVFQRFWQAGSYNRRGLGLGLHISQKIVEAHGGHIWAESEFGKGATFRFTLPSA